jgi:HlyD family secretion protein
MKARTWVGLAIVLVAAASGGYLLLHGRKQEVRWRTARVDQGSITQRVTATGTLNALIQVPVGTQVSGVVTSLTADFSSLVKRGQVIAQIDPTPWLTALKAAQAGLQQATDNQANAAAVYRRNMALWKEKLISDNDLDGFHLSLEVADSALETAKANLQTAKTNLGYCTITAPVDGVVVSRLVDVGQTVAASFSTPSLFSIAQDLAKMKVQVAIDEADIGQVRVGQPAFFTVESYPDKQFRGVVSEVQLNPVITNNVVTYNVIMEVDNQLRAGQGQDPGGEGHDPQKVSGRFGQLGAGSRGTLEYTTARYMPPGSPVYNGNLALFPGMTADCSIVTSRKDHVLRVPSSALRFNPSAYLALEETRPAPAAPPPPPPPGPAAGGAHPGTGAQGGSGSGSGVVSHGLVAGRTERIWTLADGRPKAIPVQVGISDGMYTEVTGPGIQEGLTVLTGVEENRKTQASSFGSPIMGGMRH